MKRIAPVRPGGAKEGAASSPAPQASASVGNPGSAALSEQQQTPGDKDPSPSFLSNQIRDIFASYEQYIDYKCDHVALNERETRWDPDFLNKGSGAHMQHKHAENASMLQELLNVKRHPLSDFYPLPLEAMKRRSDRDGPPYTEVDFLDQLGSLSDPPEGSRKTRAVLEIDSYTSIVEAEREQPFLIGLLQPLPSGLEVVLSIDNWRVKCNCSTDALLLKGVLPPLPAGRHFLSICTRSGYPLALLLRSSQTDKKDRKDKDEFKRVSPVFNIPFVVVRAPRRRQDPPLCYSTLKPRHETTLPATGPYTTADLDALVATSGVMIGTNRVGIPQTRKSGLIVGPNGRLVAEPKGQDFTARLAECLDSATKPKNVPVFGDPEIVLADSAYTCDVRIPLPFKISLFNSCAATSRLSIACFHSRVFVFEPYGVLSAHIFTKSCYSDIYTIFGFTLSPTEAAPHASASFRNRARASYIPGLDRFEATERLCADTRFWRYVDGCVPCKNDVAAKFMIEDFERVECPVPPMLRHARNPYADYPEGLEIAPGVSLFFEPWPEDVLPVPKRFAGDEFRQVSTAAAMQAVEAVLSQKGKAPGASAPKEESKSSREGHNSLKVEPQFFSVTLCVGKYIFNSVVGVEASVLEFIVNRWLRLVPEKKTATIATEPADSGITEQAISRKQ
ncbi:hypothetical protein TGMAS_274120 [Toxoplasma gondii MAS]|uniref:Uncharacterized protein n=1 Tax=Toxoplasma gondii MAS TaxID=943118 RepID=A0A086QX11_TOXGO|nr:hypothetical protein TGMAS_274120 [Toxoplasma gondii MAS]